MYMHAVAVNAGNGLWHKGSVYAVGRGDLLDDGFVSDHLVGHFHGFVITQVYFVLGRRDLMMGIFHMNAQFLQHQHGLPADGVRGVQRDGVKITAAVQRFGVFVIFKIKVFQFRADHKRVKTGPAHDGQVLFEDVARIPFKLFAVRGLNVAEKARNRGSGQFRREHLERVQIRQGHQVRLINARKPFHRGAVKPHAFVHGVFKFAVGQRQGL